MDYLEGLFGEDTFNRGRVKLLKKPKYGHPLMIPNMEGKALIKDPKEKKMRKEGKTPPSLARYIAI